MNTKRLKALADYLKTVPQDKFDMRLYNSNGTHWLEKIPSGSACALRHVTALLTDQEYDDYAAFASKQTYHTAEKLMDYLGLIESHDSKYDGYTVGSENLKVFTWLFGTDWAYIDNTPTGAAKRIEWLLNHGLPHDYEEQYARKAPLVYNVTELPIETPELPDTQASTATSYWNTLKRFIGIK